MLGVCRPLERRRSGIDVFSDLSTIVLMFENNAAAELAVGRSTVRRRILGLLMSAPETRLHLREIQRRATTSPGTASRELARLVAAGLIDRETEGNQVYFRAATSPFATMLRTLLIVPESDSSALTGRATAPTASLDQTPQVAGAAAVIEAVARIPRQRTPQEPPTGLSPGSEDVGLTTARRLAEGFRQLYGERLKGLDVYGPRAAGGAPPDADVEVIAVLDIIERYGDELERTSTICAGLSLELDLVVSRIFVSEADWTGRGVGQLPAVRAQAEPV